MFIFIRYFLYYWRLKTLSELLFETFPQTLVLMFIVTTTTNALDIRLLIISLFFSTVSLFYQLFLIKHGGKSSGMGVFKYLWKFYIMQGIDMIPFQDAIRQNLIRDLNINET